ncbi:MAG: hypothetical protein ACOXZR_03235 [Bacilli bacterium]
MNKLTKKGFFAVETLVVVTIAITVLTIFYRQISVLYNSYEDSFYYNRVNGLYAANNIKVFLIQNNLINLGGNDIKEIENTTDFYRKLISLSNIDKVYLTKYNLNEVIDDLNNSNYDILFRQYLKTLKLLTDDDSGNLYRVIVSFHDGTYASVILDNSLELR